jgi:hypothetical protein
MLPTPLCDCQRVLHGLTGWPALLNSKKLTSATVRSWFVGQAAGTITPFRECKTAAMRLTCIGDGVYDQ